MRPLSLRILFLPCLLFSLATRADVDDMPAPATLKIQALLPGNVATFDDGRQPITTLFAAWQRLLDRGWQLDLIIHSQPEGTTIALPIIALRSPASGPALWLMTGIHGEEPAGPNAVAMAIDDIAALGEHYPVVLLPLLNPHGYVRNWRYLNMPHYSETLDGQSVGDSSHLLPDSNKPGQARAPVSSMEADAITQYVLRTSRTYPPRYSIDLHEDNLVSEGYVYSQGQAGAADPIAAAAVSILLENDIAIKMSGQTRFDEDIVNGIVGPLADSSIDELMSSTTIIANDQLMPGPAANTVLVFETPAGKLSLAQRVNAHLALIKKLAVLIANDGETH